MFLVQNVPNSSFAASPIKKSHLFPHLLTLNLTLQWLCQQNEVAKRVSGYVAIQNSDLSTQVKRPGKKEGYPVDDCLFPRSRLLADLQ